MPSLEHQWSARPGASFRRGHSLNRFSARAAETTGATSTTIQYEFVLPREQANLSSVIGR
jgi:hypothetical protein